MNDHSSVWEIARYFLGALVAPLVGLMTYRSRQTEMRFKAIEKAQTETGTAQAVINSQLQELRSDIQEIKDDIKTVLFNTCKIRNQPKR